MGIFHSKVVRFVGASTLAVSPMQVQADPTYLTAEAFIRAKLQPNVASYRTQAIEQLKANYPQAKTEAVKPKLIDWDTVPFTIIFKGKPRIKFVNFDRTSAGVDVKPGMAEPRTYWNCDASQHLKRNITTTEKEEDVNVKTEKNTKEQKDQIQVTAEAKSGLNSVKADFQHYVINKEELFYSLSKTREKTNQYVYALDVPPNTVYMIESRVDDREEKAKARADSLVDVDLYARYQDPEYGLGSFVHFYPKPRDFALGSWSLFADDGLRSAPMTADIATTYHVVEVSTFSHAFSSVTECLDVKKKYEDGGSDFRQLPEIVAALVPSGTPAFDSVTEPPKLAKEPAHPRAGVMHFFAMQVPNERPFEIQNVNVQRKECNASVSASASLSGSTVSINFDIALDEDPGDDGASSGKIGYALRIVDADGKETILPSFGAIWQMRKGQAFSHNESVDLRDDINAASVEVIDTTVNECMITI